MSFAAPWSAEGLVGPLAKDTCGLDWIHDRDIECCSREDLVAMSDRAWQQQTALLAQRSDFYRSKLSAAGLSFDDVAGVAKLPLIPFTTKQELRKSQEEEPPFGAHLAVDPDDVKTVYQTSGTSGHPSIIALTDEDARTWRKIGVRSYFATGVHPHHSVITSVGAGPFVAGHAHGIFDEIGARRVPVGAGDTDRVLLASQLGLADTLYATPSFALHLATALEQRGIDGVELGLRHIITGGEPGGGLDSVRRRIQESFGADVTEASGLGDITPALYGECPMKGGMHFCGQGLVWVELIDPDTGEPIEIEPGAVGEPVYTTLLREAMPLVRFRSGDVVKVLDNACGCGRTSFRIRIFGRADDMFIVRGVNVYPSAVQAVIGEYRPAVTGRVRIVLEGDGVSVPAPVLVQAEVPDTSSPTPDLADRVSTAIRSRLMFRAKVEFVAQSVFGDSGYKTKPIVRIPENSIGHEEAPH